VLAANAKYAENFGDKGNLPLPPNRRFAILTCMDALKALISAGVFESAAARSLGRETNPPMLRSAGQPRR
jgi:carbonic anhydrase